MSTLYNIMSHICILSSKPLLLTFTLFYYITISVWRYFKLKMNDNNLTTNENAKMNDNNLTTNENAKPANKKSMLINITIVIIIFIGLFIYMVNVDGINNIVNLLTNADFKWVLGGVFCIVFFWICEAITLHLPLKKLYPNQKFGESFKVSMIGQLFNNLTPFCSGGQPMQAYELTKSGKRVSDSFSMLAIKFIVYQMALVLFTFVVVIFQFDFFISLMDNFLWVAILSFSVNVLAIIIVILAGINKKIISTIANPIIKLLGKIKIFKNPDKTIKKFDESLSNFNNQFKFMKEQKILILKMFLISIVQCLSYYMITYMVYRAFGNSGLAIWQIIPAQAFLLLIMTFIPTPGAGVGAEGGFLLIFNSIFKEGTINMSILFWRLYTFYAPIIVGAIFLAFSNKKEKKSKI